MKATGNSRYRKSAVQRIPCLWVALDGSDVPTVALVGHVEEDIGLQLFFDTPPQPA
ncbi:hypothetical protein PAXRUDRAFT_827595 [Paxillus rubicundulus Ve08.2h10]|uniref:Uncharacterized protein n=1 Tax=Paxillus rubicundulus Ve08.2h10 TaxID=930991 RepID=A0A0D0E8D5_9AGAM|nr:hypothetical protein PAXRUDRAFT_827595 [Paxillus rubicundulus Ve08.2h10]